MKACDQVFSESKIYATCQTDYGDVSPKILKLVNKNMIFSKLKMISKIAIFLKQF